MFSLHIGKARVRQQVSSFLLYLGCPVFPTLFRVFKLVNLLPACLSSPVPCMQVREIPL